MHALYFVVNRPFADNEPLPIGKPCENTDIIVLNENNTRVQQGEEGELCIRGTCLANGYYDNKEKPFRYLHKIHLIHYMKIKFIEQVIL